MVRMYNIIFKRLRRYGIFCISILVVANLYGCALLVFTGGAAAGVGVTYTLTNVAYKTFSSDYETVKRAAINTIKDMGISMDGSRRKESGGIINASTADLNIKINLTEITPDTTKVKVDAKRKKRLLLKDKATATEILRHMSKRLEK